LFSRFYSSNHVTEGERLLRLLVTHPGQSPRLLTFTKPEVFVGRESSCDLVLSDPDAALYHARIALQNDQAVLSNLANTGTLVNNRALTSPAPLVPGDTITIAGTTLQVLSDNAPWLELSVTDPEGLQRSFSFDKDPVTLGRVDKNDIPLPKGNISKQHTRIWRQNGVPFVNDLKSTNGTFVNGQKVTQERPLFPGDRLNIGDFVVLVVRANPSPGARVPARVPDPPAPVARMPVTPSNPPFPQRPPEPTRRDPRLSVTDPALLHSLGAGVVLGTSFAFYRPQLFQQPAFAWLLPLLGAASPQAHVVSLLGTSPVDLPGASPWSLPTEPSTAKDATKFASWWSIPFRPAPR
jgi:pSer/pThr/pTyr-binding forkhead associated (FHA) protein